MAQNQELLGVKEPVDFIFDYQHGMVTPIQDAWDSLQKIAPQFVRERPGKRPQFEVDKCIMPLQAADLHAWWIRRLAEDYFKEKPQIPFWCTDTRAIESLDTRIDEGDLIEFFRQ